MTRIIVNNYYLYENELVKVVGMSIKNNSANTRYLIQWGDSQGRACQAEVSRRELSAAPTIERLYRDYRTALDVICRQANRIEELEAQQPLFEQVMTASERYVTRFGGHLTEEGAIRKMHEEWGEVLQEIKMAQADKYLTSETYAAQDTTMRELLAREVIDFLVTIGGVLAALNVPIDLTEQAARDTLDKLDTRTTDTHQWNEETKTIERIGKVLK